VAIGRIEFQADDVVPAKPGSRELAAELAGSLQHRLVALGAEAAEQFDHAGTVEISHWRCPPGSPANAFGRRRCSQRGPCSSNARSARIHGGFGSNVRLLDSRATTMRESRPPD